MSWNWQKMNGTKNVPAFGKNVLLYEKKDDKEYVMVGNLKSIDADGCHWDIGSNVVDIFNMFGTTNNYGDFNPTNWCEIERPKEEKKEK